MVKLSSRKRKKQERIAAEDARKASLSEVNERKVIMTQ